MAHYSLLPCNWWSFIIAQSDWSRESEILKSQGTQTLYSTTRLAIKFTRKSTWSKIRKFVFENVITKKTRTRNLLSKCLRTDSIQHRGRLRVGKTDGYSNMMDTDGEQTSGGTHFRSFLSSVLGEVFLLESPEDICGRANSTWINESIQISKMGLNPLQREPGKKKKRSVVWSFVLLLPVTIPDRTCAWSLLLAHFPSLFRVFGPLHLKVSLKPGHAPSYNQFIRAEAHMHHSKQKDFLKVDSQLLMVGESLGSQIVSFATDMSEILTLKALENERQSTEQKGSGPTCTSPTGPSTKPHNNCHVAWIRLFSIPCNAQNNIIQQLL